MNQRHKDRINELIESRVFDGRGRGNYLALNRTLKPVVDEAVAQGFRVSAKDSAGRFVEWTDKSAVWFRVERIRVAQVARTPEHQTRAEARGDVAPGDDTYQQYQTRTFEGILNRTLFCAARGEPREVVDERLPLLGLLIAQALA